MKDYFYDIINYIKKSLLHDELFKAWFSAEHMDYARFNHAAIRQAGFVEQYYIDLSLIKNKKHASSIISLAYNKNHDYEIIKNIINKLRNIISKSDDDPFIIYNNISHSTENSYEHKLQDKDFCIEAILKESAGLDLVGSYVGGPLYRAFASSSGQINWFEKSSFVLDTSIYHSSDKAIKQSFGQEVFDQKLFKHKIEEAKAALSLYEKELLTINRGDYRVYFAPQAVYEILSMMNWGGFSQKALEVKNSPLMPLYTQEKIFSPQFSLSEHSAVGIGPAFQAEGFIKPAQISIIHEGKFKNALISPKTAKEYNLIHNGADDDEALSSLDLAPGTLLQDDILALLDNGLYINNIWYLNFSDRQKGCITGMTRFFCFVVKNGRAVAPFSVMRFDDSIYNIFNQNLILTKEREMIIDTSTYEERSTSSALVPGIIAEKVRFTL
jgi:predicted Zn-dependent protease